MKNEGVYALIAGAALLLVLTASAAGAADRAGWEFAGWYGGGCYPNVEFDPMNKDRVYLVSDVAGIWKSKDLGDHWEFINEGLGSLIVAFIAVAPSDAQTLYAGTKGGLYVSRNGGRQWMLCDRYAGKVSFVRLENYRSITIDPRDSAKIVIGTASGQVLRSEDYGAHWNPLGAKEEPLGVGSPVTALALIEGRAVFAGSDKGLAKFSFDNNRWQIIKNGPSAVLDLCHLRTKTSVLFGAGQDRLFWSKDLGATWQQSAPVPGGKTCRVEATELDGGAVELAVVWERGWDGGVLLSRDFGKTWIALDGQMSEDAALDPTRVWQRNGGRTTAIKRSPHNPKILLRTDWWGVWRSDDSGTSWNEKILGAPNTVGSDLVIDGKGRIYTATMDNGLLMSEDAGKTYKALFPSEGYDPAINGHVWRVLSSRDGQRIIATSSPWGENVNQVALSENGGQSFLTTREGLPAKRPKQNTMWGEGYPRALAQDPRDPNVVYLGIDGDDGGGLFVTRNGGRTWAASKGQPGSLRIYNGLAVDPADPKRIYWGAYGKKGGVYLSEDGGNSWRRSLFALTQVFDVAAATDGTVYAGGSNKVPEIYVSQNQGKGWKLLKAFNAKGAVEAVTIDPEDTKRIAVSLVQWDGVSGGAVYWTVDGGANWENITRDLPAGTGAAAMAFSPERSYLYIVRYAGSVYRLKL